MAPLDSDAAVMASCACTIVREPPAASPFRVGQQVDHPIFGRGEITALHADSPDLVTVLFAKESCPDAILSSTLTIVPRLGPQWGFTFGAQDGAHVRVAVRHGTPGSRASLGELTMTVEESMDFRAAVESLGAHVTDVCGYCRGTGEVILFYPRPGGPPGNQTVPCRMCRSRDVSS